MPAWDYCAEFSSVSWAELQNAGHWTAKYRLILHWGKAIGAKPWLRQDEYLIRGCETSLWLAAERRAGVWHFALDGDARVVKGLAALVLSALNGRAFEPAELQALSSALAEAGVSQHLSPSRNNGLRALITHLQVYCAE